MNHEKLLRSWYLAHLRKSLLSVEMTYQSTPSALVGADSEAIRQVLLANSTSAPRELPAGRDIPLALLMLGVIVLSAVVALVFALLI